MEFAEHFLYIDPFKKKFNSPLDYTEMDIEDMTEELVESGKIRYCFIRSDQWVFNEYYGIVYSLFRKDIELNRRDREVYDLINNSTFNELKKSGIGEQDLKDSLIKLESGYHIRKTVKKGIQYYIRNEEKPEKSEDAMKHAISLVLSSFGPLSFDELLIRLPVNNEELESSLNEMTRSGKIIFDYITPIFMKQYMMKSDFDAIINNTEYDLSSRRISNFSQQADSIEDYFNSTG